MQHLERLIYLAKRHAYETFAARTPQDDLSYSLFRSVFRITRKRAAETKDETGFWRWLAEVSQDRQFKPPQPRRMRHARHDRDTPTTAQVVALAHLLEAVLASLGPIDQLLLLLRVEGCSIAEISNRLSLDATAVRGRLEHSVAQIGRLLGVSVAVRFD